MKKIENLRIIGILSITIFFFQGCYTQLAFDRRIVVTEQSVYQSQEKYLSQSDSIPDTLQNNEIPSSIIVQQHYWLLDPYGSPFGYDPFFYDINYYHSYHFLYCDPYRHPRCYSRYQPYWPGYNYAGWNCYDPFWYDPYWGFSYYSGHYSGYYSGYGYPYWGGYHPVYIGDPIDDKKRDWDRRGADFASNTIVRPSNSSPGQSSLVNVIERTEMGSSTNSRNENNIVKPIRRNDIDSEIIKTNIHRSNNNEDKYQTVKWIYRRTKDIISPTRRSGNSDNKKSNNTKNSTVKRQYRSDSNHSTNKSVSRSASASSSRSNSTSNSSSKSNSGKSRSRSTKSRTRK